MAINVVRAVLFMTKLQKLSHAVLKAQVAFEEEKAHVKALHGANKYHDCTIYVIRETYVKRHYRRATVAVRVKRGTL